ncbi:MAG: C39 family peptidase [Chloroflexota bacterium]|nr:C39 family peptidase [Chloroflexota bacterium]
MRGLFGRLAVLVTVLAAVASAPSLATAGAGVAGSAYVDVPTYVQQRNLSCEYASLSIATGAWGNWVSEWEFDHRVGWSDNPHWGFRGNINGWWGNTTDYGVYAEPLVAPLAEFGFYGEVFYGGGDAGALTARLDEGAPVVVWLGLWGDQSYYEYAADGTPYKLTPGYHVVVANGYDEGGVHVSDPATGSYNYYGWGDFMWMWNVLDGMGLAVWPA